MRHKSALMCSPLAAVMRALATFLAFAAHAQVITAQYGNERTGATLTETMLTPENVNAEHFGKLESLPVDGDVYAQPLYVPQLEIAKQGKRNLLIVATEHDSVYAFDADGFVATPLWHTTFLNREKGITTVPPTDLQCPFIRPEVGITPTPVIDLKTSTIYVLARTKEHGQFVQRLHALDLRSGAEKLGGPVVIEAFVQGLGHDGTQVTVAFNPLRENPRAALLLARNTLYLTWASACDVGPYHGWIMAYDANTLKRSAVFNTSPDGSQAGIWQGDAGPAADRGGNLYFVTGNGTFDTGDRKRDFGDTILKLGLDKSKLSVRDYFTPFNQAKLNADDLDLGSSGPVLLPDQAGAHRHLLVAAGKGEGIYVVDRDRMGKYRESDNGHAVQLISGMKHCFGAPAYWNNRVYYACENDALTEFVVRNGSLSPLPSSQSIAKFTGVGATPSVSANGNRNGIVWVVATQSFFSKDASAVLRAYDARDLGRELYSSEQNSARDRAGPALRFTMPLVADGKVYLGTKKVVEVYGLISAPPVNR